MKIINSLTKAVIEQQSKFIFINVTILLLIILGTICIYILIKHKYKLILPIIITLQNTFLTLILFVNTAIFTLIIDGGGGFLRDTLYETAVKNTSDVLTVLSVIGILLFIMDIILLIVTRLKKC